MHDRSDHHSAATRHLSSVLSSSGVPEHPSLQAAIDANLWTSGILRDLAAQVGGVDVLAALDVDPLPSSRVDLAGVHPAHAGRVRDVVEAVDHHGRRLLDDEHTTIIHRLVEAVIRHDPKVLGRGEPVNTAAALTWLALRGNGELGGRRWPTAEDIWCSFGVSSCASRGRTLFTAAGFTFVDDCSPTGQARQGVRFDDVDFLHSRTRGSLLAQRDQALRLHEDALARQQASRAVQRVGDGKVRIQARTQVPRWSFLTLSAAGRRTVVVALADSADRALDDVEALALSVPDARRLVEMLQNTLDGPLTPGTFPPT